MGEDRSLVNELLQSQPCELDLFGPFRLRAPDGAHISPSGRKARALLAYLVVARLPAASRERLAGLLWSERGEEQARASLRQTLYEMRSITAPPLAVLSVDRAQVVLHLDRVRSDLDRIRALAGQHDADALAAQLGERPLELLEDLDGIDPAFDEWLLVERVQRRDERRRIALDVGARALTADQPGAALRLAGCLLAADPIDEAAARLAMAASHALGDRDSVRQVHARLAAALRKSVDAAPSAETEAWLRELTNAPASAALQWFDATRVDEPRTDSALIAPPTVDSSPAPLPREPATDLPPTGPAPTVGDGVEVEEKLSIQPHPPRRRSMRRWALGAALLLFLLASGIAFWASSPPDAGSRLLLVQALAAPPGDAAALELGQGLGTDLARMMVGNDQRLSVTAPEDVSASARRRARFAVSGTASTTDGVLHADVKLVSVPDSLILWSKAFARPSAESQALREQIASKLADVAICALGGRNPPLEALGAETLRLYLGACEHKHDNWGESARLLGQVVQRSPQFAHAWAMLAAGTTASIYLRPNEKQALRRQAEVYAAHALALDPHDGEAYYARSETLPGLARWAERMSVLEEGHAADPQNAPTNGRIANSLASVGRWTAAIAFAQQAEDADPFSPAQAAQLTLLLGFGPDPGDAATIVNLARKRFPGLSFVTNTELSLAGLIGDPRRALAMLEDSQRPTRLSPERVEAWKTFLAARLDPAPARVEAAVLAVRGDAARLAPGDFSDVEKMVVLGRVEEAYGIATTAAAGADPNENSDAMRLFRSDMAPFRADRRFMALAARLGLVSIWQQTDKWPDFCQTQARLPYDCRRESQSAIAAVH